MVYNELFHNTAGVLSKSVYQVYLYYRCGKQVFIRPLCTYDC